MFHSLKYEVINDFYTISLLPVKRSKAPGRVQKLVIFRPTQRIFFIIMLGLIVKNKLGYKIHHKKELTKEDREALVYILRALRSSKARWNYIVIFVFSILALVYAVVVDIIKWLG